MKTIKENNLIVIPRSEIIPGDDIARVIKKAAFVEREHNDSVGFMFNGVQMILSPNELDNLKYKIDPIIEDQLKVILSRYNHQMMLQHPFPVNKFD